MKALLDDLVDFNRTKLGLGINVALADIDLAAVFADELEQLRGAHPGRRIELEVVGDTRGRWDGLRLQQLLRNLVVECDQVRGARRAGPRGAYRRGGRRPLEVANSGPAIERSALDQIFDPLKRGPAQRTATTRTAASGSDCISCAKLPGRMGARSMCVPTREKPCSLCGCLAAMRAHRPEQHQRIPSNSQENAWDKAPSWGDDTKVSELSGSREPKGDNSRR